MSRITTARNVNDAFENVWHWMRAAGVRENSRNGPVLVAPGMYITEYTHPQERVLFNPKRDCNHVFHLMETIWMLAGRCDSAWPAQFNSTYENYADQGVIHGAYGHRWRNNFQEGDQLLDIVSILKADPNSRQAVLQMWDYEDGDLVGTWRDRPCNTHAYFDLRGHVLNMTVCCRSNDILWGAYGANVVHFSILQEVLARALGVKMGMYRQVSNNFHFYLDNPTVKTFMDNPPLTSYDMYERGLADVIPFTRAGETLEEVLRGCESFCKDHKNETGIYFLDNIAAPLCEAYLQRKRGVDFDLRSIPSCDWKLGYEFWLKNRRKENVGE